SVLKLRPISYQWKDEGVRVGTGTSLGFSAQELQQIIPDAVVAQKGKTPEDADHTYYGVKYAEIIPVLVKAIQEQQELIEQLRKEVNELK
ncbi:MAG: tail fiber domain-containing protein, partial [Bacteroidales bacterium]